MENIEGPQDQLRELERAEAAPYIDYPATYWWFPPALGAWTAAMIGVLFWGNKLWLAPLILIELVTIWAYSRAAGSMPSFRRVPPEIRSAYGRYIVGCAAAVALAAAANLWIGRVACLVTVFLAVTVGYAIYDRHYRAAAERVRDRLR